MNRKVEFALKNLETNYFLTDEECGFFNLFTRLTDAEKACKEVSAKLNITVFVTAVIEDIVYSNGKKLDYGVKIYK